VTKLVFWRSSVTEEEKGIQDGQTTRRRYTPYCSTRAIRAPNFAWSELEGDAFQKYMNHTKDKTNLLFVTT
jgi:hypothetical protein